MRSRGARAAAAQRAARGAGELRAAKHAGLVVAAAGHERPVLRGGGRREGGGHVEVRKHLAALPAEEALRGRALSRSRPVHARMALLIGLPWSCTRGANCRACERALQSGCSATQQSMQETVSAQTNATDGEAGVQPRARACASAAQLWSRRKLGRVSSCPSRMLMCLPRGARTSARPRHDAPAISATRENRRGRGEHATAACAAGRAWSGRWPRRWPRRRAPGSRSRRPGRTCPNRRSRCSPGCR